MQETPQAAQTAEAHPNFYGQYTRAVDIKGRLSLPFRFRPDRKDAERYVVFNGGEGALVLYPEAEWEQKFKELQKASPGAEWRGYMRQISASLASLDLDAQGRIMVPRHFLAAVNVERKVLVVGLGPFMELWSPEGFAELQAKTGPLPAKFTDLLLG
jgi:MraZ protein